MVLSAGDRRPQVRRKVKAKVAIKVSLGKQPVELLLFILDLNHSLSHITLLLSHRRERNLNKGL